MPRTPRNRLQPHHLAWLACHPERTKEWLLDMLADGFHVHHVDGDHSNDDKRNLVLLEGLDHMLLFHGMKNFKLNAIAGRAGAAAKLANSTPKQRSAWARKAVRKRWANVRRAKKEAAKAVAAANRAGVAAR